MERFLKVFFLLGFVLSFELVMQNCGGGFESFDPASLGKAGDVANGKAAFENTVYAFGKSKNCTNCHATTQAPLFVAPSLDTAYSAARAKVNFANPDASTLISKSGDGHCGANCQGNANAMKAQVQAWVAAELAPPDPKTVFESTVYAFGKSKSCNNCHGTSQAPLFVSASLDTAYNAAKAKVTFSNPDASSLISKSGDGHCGANCQGNADAMKAKVREWASAELAAVPTSKITTASLAMPSTIPTAPAAPTVLRFPFSSASGPVPTSLNGALIEVELQMSTPSVYRVSRLKIAGNTAAVRVSGVHVYTRISTGTGIGGEFSPSNSPWTRYIGIQAPISALPATLPAGPLVATPISIDGDSLLIPKAGAAADPQDVMTLVIDDIR